MELRTVDRLEELPNPAPEATYVVVDVIICSTAIIRLLEAGAASVKPFATTAEALEFRDNNPRAVLIGEENDGQAVDAFDLSPVPELIAEADIAGRPVGIRTSNGTRAIDRIGLDKEILIGSTVNAGAVAETLTEADSEIWIVAAGRNGTPVVEDRVGAQLIAAACRDEDAPKQSNLREQFKNSPSTDWLRSVGQETELDTLLDFHSTDLVPVLKDGAFVPE